ncbi:MAG: hypothetical protein JXA35_02560 [Deltaproteobacteria bacterium]|nr:hypothetical protein [Deltaproteobacteria bacterium]
MKIKSCLAGLLVAGACLLVLTSFLSATEKRISGESLRGIDAIYVYVEPLSPDIEKLGLNSTILKNDVVVKLESAGIRTMSRDRWLREEGSPYLDVMIRVLALADAKEFIYSIDIAFRQNVYPLRIAVEISGASTWSTGGVIGITPNLEKIRKSLRDQTDLFINSFLSINPGYKRAVEE